jgi:hypothetical protein
MKKFLVAIALIASFAVGPAFAQTAPTDVTTDRGAKGADSITPGAVGPGSENNAHVSPTSPTIPMHSQPPGDIPASSGAGSGTSGTAGPHDPTPPSNSSPQ